MVFDIRFNYRKRIVLQHQRLHALSEVQNAKLLKRAVIEHLVKLEDALQTKLESETIKV